MPSIDHGYMGYTCGPCIRTFENWAEYQRHKATDCRLKTRPEPQQPPSGRVWVTPEVYAKMIEDAKLGQLTRKLLSENTADEDVSDNDYFEFVRLLDAK